jgi:hypothetical protein
MRAFYAWRFLYVRKLCIERSKAVHLYHAQDVDERHQADHLRVCSFSESNLQFEGSTSAENIGLYSTTNLPKFLVVYQNHLDCHWVQLAVWSLKVRWKCRSIFNNKKDKSSLLPNNTTMKLFQIFGQIYNYAWTQIEICSCHFYEKQIFPHTHTILCVLRVTMMCAVGHFV